MVKSAKFSVLSSISIILTVLTIASGFFLSSSRVSADDSVIDDVSINVQVSCTMSGVGMNSHTTTINPGTYQTDIGKTTLTVFCNDNGGFAVYAIGYTGDTYTGTDHTKLIGEAVGEKIATGTATGSNTNDPSNWAMKLVKVTNESGQEPITYNPENLTIENGYGNYSIVPDTYTKVASYSSTTDYTLGSKLETTYATFINSSQVADTYNGKVKYVVVHPSTKELLQPQTATSGCINYFANTSDSVGTMGCQSISTSAVSATLLASNFSREGYGFAGWSDAYDYATNPNAHFYGPQEDITFAAGQYTGDNDGLALYAVWVKSIGNLQDDSKVAQLCGTGTGSLTPAPIDGTANLSSVSALTDQRDGQTYAIAKLADERCWIIENLRLEAENTVGNNYSNPSITNASLAQGYGTSTTYGNFTGLATAESANFNITNPPVANSLYSTDSTTANTIQGGDSTYYYARMPRYNNTNTATRADNPTSNTFKSGSTIPGMYSYGNYYTWSAAMATIKQYTSPTSTDDEGKTSTTANTSICPTGWKLPIGNQSTATNSFGALSVALGGPANGATANTSSTPTGTVMSKIFRSFPNNFLVSGFISSAIFDRGSNGYYWSSTARDNSTSYYFRLLNTYAYPGTTYNVRNIGRSVRCTTLVSE